jgi:hypothetical protein
MMLSIVVLAHLWFFMKANLVMGSNELIFEKMLYIIITNVFTTLQNITVIGRKVTESQC